MVLSEVVLYATIGLLAGIASGSLGIGGGIIIVPALVFFAGFSQHQAQGTSLSVLVIPVVALSVFNYYKEGYINIKVAAIIAITFAAGGYLGSLLAVNIPAGLLKKIFGFLLLVVAFKMIFGR